MTSIIKENISKRRICEVSLYVHTQKLPIVAVAQTTSHQGADAFSAHGKILLATVQTVNYYHIPRFGHQENLGPISPSTLFVSKSLSISICISEPFSQPNGKVSFE